MFHLMDRNPAEEYQAIVVQTQTIQVGIAQARDARIRGQLFSGVQNQSGCAGWLEAAGATGGAREGRPTHSRIFRVASG